MSIHHSKAGDEAFVQQAYAAVANVPTLEPNDRNRLGYHIWLYLRGEVSSIEEAVQMARSRYVPKDLPRATVVKLVEEGLRNSSATPAA